LRRHEGGSNKDLIMINMIIVEIMIQNWWIDEFWKLTSGKSQGDLLKW